jgi:argininosuccinate lyase
MRERIHEPLGRPFIDTVLKPRLEADAETALPAMIAANQAHLVMLVERGLIAPGPAALVARALADLARRGIPPGDLDPGLEDLYANVERAVARAAGEDAAGRMHVARSRNDLWATVSRIGTRAALDRTMAALLDLRARLLALAAGHADHVVPGYTHLQPAQPITAGFYFLGVAEALARDTERLGDAFRRVNRCPLGACALAGTSFPIDRDLVARLLGFDGPVRSALDAVASRDYVLECLGHFSVLAVALARLAADLYFWSSAEVRIAGVSGAIAVVSSIMPQKKNAAALEHLRGRAGHVAGALAAALTAAAGTHFMHSRETSVEVTMALARGEADLAVILALAAAVLDGIEVRPDAGDRCCDDFSTLTDLADALVREADMPFRLAHEVCAALAREAIDAGRGASSLDAAAVNATASARAGRPVALSEAAVRAALDPDRSVAGRTSAGGTAPAEVRRMLAEAERVLAADRAGLAATRQALDAAKRELEVRCSALANA